MTCKYHWIPGNHAEKTGYRMDLEQYLFWLTCTLDRPDLADCERYPWLKSKPGSIDTKEKRLAYLDWLCAVFGYDDPVKLIRDFGREYLKRQPMGGCLVNTNTLTSLLAELNPDDKYPERHLQCAPSGTLKDYGYRRSVMEEDVRAGRSFEDLYTITQKCFKGSSKARSLLVWYKGSPVQAVRDIYGQEYNFVVPRFKNLPNTFLRSEDKQRDLLDLIESELGIRCDEDWYDVVSRDVYDVDKGMTLLGAHYGGSIYVMLKKLKPDTDWQLERFAKRPPGYWQDDDNCRYELGKFLGERGLSPEELYLVSNKELLAAGLNGIINRFGGVRGADKHLYRIERNEWEYTDVPNDFWDDINNVRARICEVLDKLGRPVTTESLHNLDQKTLRHHGCGGLFAVRRDTSQVDLIMEAFPDLGLDPAKFSRYGKFQNLVKEVLSKILNTPVLAEYKGHGLRYSKTRYPISVDLYLPEFDLYIECQGEAHFRQSN